MNRRSDSERRQQSRRLLWLTERGNCREYARRIDMGWLFRRLIGGGFVWSEHPARGQIDHRVGSALRRTERDGYEATLVLRCEHVARRDKRAHRHRDKRERSKRLGEPRTMMEQASQHAPTCSEAPGRSKRSSVADTGYDDRM